MIRTDCPCLDCKRNNAIAAAASAPIHRQPWQDAAVANEVQTKAWGSLVDKYLNAYPKLAMVTVVMWVCDDVHVRPENFKHVSLMVERFIRESPKYLTDNNHPSRLMEGGMIERKPAGESDRSFVPLTDELAPYRRPVPSVACSQGNDPSFGEVEASPDELVNFHLFRYLPTTPMEQSAAINDHICPGCGNDKCSKTERTCWKCGGAL